MGDEETKKRGIYEKAIGQVKGTWTSFFKLGAAWASIPLSIGVLVVVSLLLGTISCMIRPGVTYERFDAELSILISQTELTKKVKQAVGLLQKDEVLLDAVADKACAVYKQVSDALVKNASAPTLDMIQPVDQAALNARGRAQFEETKRSYLAKNCGQEMLECFADQEGSAAEEELRAAIVALDAQLNASKMKLKARKITGTLGFTGPYLEEIVKAIEGFNGTECGSSAISKVAGADLVAKGVALYNEAMKVHAMIQTQPGVAKLQTEALAAINAKKNKFNSGPSESDTEHYKKEGEDPKYRE